MDNYGIFYGRVLGHLTAAEYAKNDLYIFKKVFTNQSAPTPGNFGYGMAMGATTYYFFSKGPTKAKRINAINLKGKLIDNPEANKFVLLATKQQTKSRILFGIGALTAIGAIIVGLNNLNGFFSTSPVYMIVPLGFFGAGIVFHVNSKRNAKKAVTVTTDMNLNMALNIDKFRVMK
ncbi:MAG TPA: hypothetical protein VFF27_05070 [Bacteroidia bacterium]|jgi:hypothetical protein|nr:hypothetical protein [Bacteroidia bacterium]